MGLRTCGGLAAKTAAEISGLICSRPKPPLSRLKGDYQTFSLPVTC